MEHRLIRRVGFSTFKKLDLSDRTNPGRQLRRSSLLLSFPLDNELVGILAGNTADGTDSSSRFSEGSIGFQLSSIM